jgi:hypothetical protein
MSIGLTAPSHQRSSVKAAQAVTVLFVLVFVAPVLAQQSTPDRLAPVNALVGKWVGTSEGQPGNGTVERTYEHAIGERFVRVRNRSTYPPQPKNPKGETHEDEGFIGFDNGRKLLTYRQFHIERFVVTYVQDPNVKPGTIVFTSEAIENIPAGYRARETYLLHGPDEFEEVFEMAEPGKDFEVYSRTRLKRVR